MRRVVLSLSVFAVAFAGAARADDAEAKKVIDKALKAHGGAEILAKLKDKAFVMKGKMSLAQLNDAEAKLEGFVVGEKFKYVVDLSIMGMDINQQIVYDGKSFWITVNGTVMMEIKGKDLDPIKEMAHAQDLSSLVGLLDKGLTFSTIGESKVDDKPAVGVRVSKKGFKDVSMHFDKQSGLLLKTESQSFDFMTSQEVGEETFLKDYKNVDGVKYPTRMLVHREGKKYVEMEFSEVKVVDKLDDTTFNKP